MADTKVKYSCVMDQHPRFARQAFVWALSLLIYAGEEPERLVVHTVGQLEADYLEVIQRWGIQRCVVEPFDSRHSNSNKLVQLESQALHLADYVVLCDCDTAFCSSISAWVRGEAIRARVAAYAGLSSDRWKKLFQAADLPLPSTQTKALLDGEDTLPSYCNGGLYIIPQHLFQRLREAWPRWERWLLDRPALIDPLRVFADQISFTLSCEQLGIVVDHLPLEMNWNGVAFGRALRRVKGSEELQPLVLHYHRFDVNGLLRLPVQGIPSVNRQVRKINNLIRLAERVNFDLSSLLLLSERRTA